ncbi:peptide chain release factor 1 [Acidisoma sp. 7E03]
MGLMQRSITWKLEELDRILNDPTAPMEAHRVWSLLDDISSVHAAEDRPAAGKACHQGA